MVRACECVRERAGRGDEVWPAGQEDKKARPAVVRLGRHACGRDGNYSRQTHRQHLNPTGRRFKSVLMDERRGENMLMRKVVRRPARRGTEIPNERAAAT